MDNTEKLLRAFIKAQGYEIQELDAKPCVKQCAGMPVIFDGGDYKVTKKPIDDSLRLNSVENMVKLHSIRFGPSVLK